MQIKLRVYLLLFAFILFVCDLLLKLNISTQISFLVFVLILFGVPHGALDLYIDQHLNKSSSSHKFFLFKYITNILVYSLIWYFFPILALFIFIAITAFHFGEVDWIGKTNTVIHKIAYTFIGFLWILFLLSKNIQFALDIFLKMGKSSVSSDYLINLAHKIYPITLWSLAFVYVLLFIFSSYFFYKKENYFYSLGQQIILVAFALYMPLWICFAFYFGFWHSLLSFDKIRVAFQIPNDFSGWKSLLIKALPFSLMAWFGFSYITFLSYKSSDTSGIFTLLFITLAVLALPHLQVFTKLRFKGQS